MESMSHIDGVSTVVKAISAVLGLGLNEINTVPEDCTFVKLGGDSLAAIFIAAECQKDGISIPASVFLRASTLKEAIAKAESSAQLLHIHSTALLTPAPPLLRSQFPETVTTASSSHSETGGDGSSSLSSPYDTAITTPDLEASNALSYYNGQKIISARDLLGRINATEWTELQLLLLREIFNDQRRNILTIHKAYTGEWDAQLVCNVWTNTILAESVETEEDFQRELHNAVLVDCPLSHLTVVQLASSSVTVVWHVHHSFMDGFSARILHGKISRNLLGGGPTASPGPSFKDTVRTLGRLREERREATRRFWDCKRARFPCAVGELCLNPQRVHDGLTSQRYITIPFPKAELAAARVRTGYTITVYFAAAWALTLGKFMDTDQVYFGMVLPGRDLPILGAFDVVGPLINILPLFVQLPLEGDRETSVRAFLRCIQEGILELNDVHHSDTTEGFGRQFTSIMATQFEEYEGVEQSPPVDPNRLDMQSGTPLNLIIQGQSRLQVFYSTAHYSEEDMNNVWSVFQNGMNCFLQGDDNIWESPGVRDGPYAPALSQLDPIFLPGEKGAREDPQSRCVVITIRITSGLRNPPWFIVTSRVPEALWQRWFSKSILYGDDDLFDDEEFLDGIGAASVAATESEPEAQDPSEGAFTQCAQDQYRIPYALRTIGDS
ncbi:hypothetical protein DL768_006852 [Monosporascus sp. mg162]|nr:hypothetical protein DL768_006852 [Monosporascus sp. mg162]